MNTLENNKLIAEFMGRNWDDVMEMCKQEVYDSGHRSDSIIDDPEYWSCYNSDWNWLMAVVEKIENIKVKGSQWSCITDEDEPVEFEFTVAIKNKVTVINRHAFDGDEEDFLSIYDGRNYTNGSTKIENTYNACIAFIKWYNEQNK